MTDKEYVKLLERGYIYMTRIGFGKLEGKTRDLTAPGPSPIRKAAYGIYGILNFRRITGSIDSYFGGKEIKDLYEEMKLRHEGKKDD